MHSFCRVCKYEISKERLQNCKGFSIGETLIAMLILLLASSIVAAGIPVARDAYEKIVLNADAQVLLSTTITSLRDELGTALDIVIDTEGSTSGNNKITYTSADTGAESEISFNILEDIKGIAIKEYGTPRRLVSEAVGGNALYAICDSFSWGSANKDLLKVNGLCVKHSVGDSVKTMAGPIDLEIRIVAPSKEVT